MSKMIRPTILLLAVALTFTLAGVAEAGSLASHRTPGFDKVGVSETGGFLAQAWAWLTSFWTETTLLEKSGTAAEGSDTTSNTTTCTNPNGCETGYGLDPNG
jgi:hypothetical protein